MVVIISGQSVFSATGKPPKRYPEHRTCVVCGSRLSRYNRSNLYCAVDEAAAMAERRVKYRGHQRDASDR